MGNDLYTRKIALPRISRVELSHFDLYSLQPNPSVAIDRSVFCLIGANGLGKSTFLNTVNFAVTGAVPDPTRRFQSAQEYFRSAVRVEKTEDYFSGRFSEAARPLAKVAIQLAWSEAVVDVEREIFGGSAITSLRIRESTGSDTTYPMDSGHDAEAMDAIYQDAVLKYARLDDFAQFVFLFHFVATFDEGRHLLMWDDAALTNALYLAFGADPASAKEADRLKREMDKESSRGRNIRFQAKNVTDRIGQLVKLLQGSDIGDPIDQEELRAKHELLISEHSVSELRVSSKQAELRDVDLKWTDLSARLTEAQMEYRRLFTDRLSRSSSFMHHPLIISTLADDCCGVCGTREVAARINTELAAHTCPMCESVIEPGTPDTDALGRLKAADQVIARIRDELASVLTARERLSREVDAAAEAERVTYRVLRDFEGHNAVIPSGVPSSNDAVTLKGEVVKLQREHKDLLAQSEAHYAKRDVLREKLRVYEKDLKKRYSTAAEEFVPRFRELAEEFIGLPVDVELDHRQGANAAGFGLRLRMNDHLRSRPDKVSESQRFFLDIALRMALSEFMSAEAATLLIDTPEGSLDIAYEARAGAMFSKFVATGNFVVMTANLRSSQLVLRLAQLQKESGMRVMRMTDWTELSTVQQSEEALFTSAYEDIDNALRG